MIRTALIVALAAAALPVSAIAAEPAKPEATAPAAKPKYTTAETDIGTLLDDPAAKAIIDRAGHSARVVSVPSFELFEAESEDYKAGIIGEAPVKVAIEAAVRQGWDRFIGNDGIFIGMHRFGSSAPYEDLYKKFGITAEAAADAALKRLKALA